MTQYRQNQSYRGRNHQSGGARNDRGDDAKFYGYGRSSRQYSDMIHGDRYFSNRYDSGRGRDDDGYRYDGLYGRQSQDDGYHSGGYGFQGGREGQYASQESPYYGRGYVRRGDYSGGYSAGNYGSGDYNDYQDRSRRSYGEGSDWSGDENDTYGSRYGRSDRY